MNFRCGKLVLAVLVALSASCLCAQDGLEGALSRADLVPTFGTTLAIADFDHDNRPDGAVLLKSDRSRGTTFRIELHYSTRANIEVAFKSTESLHGITALDIDNDTDADVVVEQPITHRRLHVWLNDGHGSFTESQVVDSIPNESCREHLTIPFRALHPLAPCLRAQRGSGTATAVPRRLTESPLVTGEFERPVLPTWPASAECAENRSRAPPLFSHLAGD